MRAFAPYLAGGVAIVALGALVIVRDARRERQLDAIARQMTAASAERPRVDPAPSPVAAPGTMVIEPNTDAIAAKVAAMLDARLRAEAAEKMLHDSPPVPTQQQQRAVDRANAKLDGALQAGRLSRDDVIAMRSALAESGMSDARDAIASRIAVAINAGRLIPEDRHFIVP